MVWELRLYVVGQTPKSMLAFANLKLICEEHLKGRYKIEVIDLLKHPQLARSDQITIPGAPANPDAGPVPDKFTPPPPEKLYIDYTF